MIGSLHGEPCLNRATARHPAGMDYLAVDHHARRRHDAIGHDVLNLLHSMPLGVSYRKKCSASPRCVWRESPVSARTASANGVRFAYAAIHRMTASTSQ